MSSNARTPSPPHAQPLPPNTPMPPPTTPRENTSADAGATPGSSPLHNFIPNTPNSRNYTNSVSFTSPSPGPQTPHGHFTSPSPTAKTPHRSATPHHTPSGGLPICTTDPSLMKDIKVHTAICTICNRRNKDVMKRCPGCTWQICKDCREKREREGRSLTHSNMGTPSGLGSTLGSRKVQRRVVNVRGSPASGEMCHGTREELVGKEMGSEKKGKGTATAKSSSKKRMPSGKKARANLEHDYDDDDDFRPDPTSPTPHKRRRTTHNITDTPTATSARPSRTAPATTTYVDPDSSESSPSSTAAADPPSAPDFVQTNPESRLNTENVIASNGPIQELLEREGVNMPGHRYEEHFLGRCYPVVTDPVIRIPEAVKRMSEKEPRMTAVQKLEARTKQRFIQMGLMSPSDAFPVPQAQMQETEERAHASTVQGVDEAEAMKHEKDT